MIDWIGPGQPFPPVANALTQPNGLLAAGSEINAQRLLEAYPRGIFPWYGDGDPVLWWSPDPRMVLETAQFHVSHSLRKTLRAVARDPERQLELDADFGSVMQACAEPRPGQDGTWIVPELMAAYCDLAQAGHAVAMSLKDAQGQLLGAAYGVSIGRMFYGESMVSRVRDGSKIALAALVALLRREQVPVIDCQQKTGHLASLGARTVPRAGFCERVAQLADLPQLDWAPYRGRRLNFLLETD